MKALGDEIRHDKLEISLEVGSTYTTMVKLEIVCNDDNAEKAKEIIMKHARTGHKRENIRKSV